MALENKDAAYNNTPYYRYEYQEQPLVGDSKLYIKIPSTVILDKDMDSKRAAAFTYLAVHRGLNNHLIFSVDDVVKWTGAKADRHKGAINSKYVDIINQFSDRGYFDYSGNLTLTSYVNGVFNINKVERECSEYRFAILYLDEIRQLLRYKEICGDAYVLNNTILLLVFSYLKMKIPKRANKFRVDERLKDRRLNYPEAYDCFIIDIASDLGLSPDSVAKAIKILNEMYLIYSESLPHVKINDNKIRRQHMIFCCFYKRERDNLLAIGESYYMTEIKNKKARLKKITQKEMQKEGEQRE